MKYLISDINLNEEERLWLSNIYDNEIVGNATNYRILRAQLSDKLSPSFNPQSIDGKLLRGNTNITFLGVLYLYPDTDIFIKTNKIITYIRDLLLKNSDLYKIDFDELSKEFHIPVCEISFIFNLFYPYISLWQSASSVTIDGKNYYNRISLGDDNVINYFNFASIEKLIIDHYKENGKKSIGEDKEKNGDFDNIPLKPIFNSKITHTDQKLCFVLMPFNEDWSDSVYADLIRKNVESLKLQCLRADNLTGQIVIEDIWTKINQSAIIIADVTTRNPNVMYELGIVHTIGKPTILMTQDIDDIPFDFKHLRHYAYDFTYEGFNKFSITLRNVIKDIYNDNYSILLDDA